MLELGQPLHAFDRGQLTGRDRRTPGPAAGSRSRPSTTSGATLDRRGPGHRRRLAARSALAGMMGGLRPPRSTRRRTDIALIEAAHFAPAGDRPHVPPAQAVQRGVAPLRARRRPGLAAVRRGARRGAAASSYGGGTYAGHDRGRGTVRRHRQVAARRPELPRRRRRASSVPTDAGGRRGSPAVGCAVRRPGADGLLTVTPPSLAARPDRPQRPGRGGVRLEGYDALPSALPPRAAGSRAHRARSGSAAGSAGRWPRRGLHRGAVATRSSARPSSTRSACRPTTRAGGAAAGQPALRRGSRCCARRCCPGCWRPLRAQRRARHRPTSRCSSSGPVFLPRRRSAAAPAAAPAGRPHGRPTRARRARRGAARPAAARSPPCSRPASASGRLVGPGRGGGWADAVEAPGGGRAPSASTLVVRAGQHGAVAPGPLRRARRRRRPSSATPASCTRGRAPRSGCRRAPRAMELDLDALLAAAPGRAATAGSSATRWPRRTSRWSSTAGRRRPTSRRRCAPARGELLESVRLFDVYTGEQVGAGQQVPGLRAALPGARTAR